MKKGAIFCIIIIAIGLLCVSPVSARTVSVKVSKYNINKASSAVTPYIDIGYWHYGSYSIKGSIYYKYNGNRKWQYADSGTILPTFSRYWGWRFKAPYIYTWKFTGTAYF
ncbi:MAG: hypothetical protein CIT01_03270 [Methanobacterium sp. BRmetb2]|jgi:hypothetical protein|nr:MAG: hypothetical protein CIT01_03270 [Methanobacterium sp. BRmetb2]